MYELSTTTEISVITQNNKINIHIQTLTTQNNKTTSYYIASKL